MKLSWRQCRVTHMREHTQANNLVWIITATVCLNDFYTHFNGSLWCDNTNSPPVEGRWRKSGNYFSIKVSVNPPPHIDPLLRVMIELVQTLHFKALVSIWFPKDKNLSIDYSMIIVLKWSIALYLCKEKRKKGDVLTCKNELNHPQQHICHHI